MFCLIETLREDKFSLFKNSHTHKKNICKVFSVNCSPTYQNIKFFLFLHLQVKFYEKKINEEQKIEKSSLKLFIHERKRKIIVPLFYAFIDWLLYVPWPALPCPVLPCPALTGNWTCNLGISEQSFNQLSYQARTKSSCFSSSSSSSFSSNYIFLVRLQRSI